MNRSPLRAFLLIPLVLGWFALSQTAQAVCQEGCLTGENTVLGEDALLHNTSVGNTAIGSEALRRNTTGTFNTANGESALRNNTRGVNNTANGTAALSTNTGGNSNTAIGSFSLFTNSTGDHNTATGFLALVDNTTGRNNTAIGSNALLFSTGSDNIAFGFEAGRNLTTGDNNIYIANKGVAGDSNTIRIGRVGRHSATYIAGISGTAVVGDTVVVDANGQLGTVASAAHFKKEIKPMDKTSEAILALKPVSFQYKSDRKGTLQFGLIAEEVAKVNPDLVVRDRKGEIYSVRYEAVNAMLLNEFIKQHNELLKERRKNEEQEATIARQQKQIEALTAGLQKVSAEVEMSRRAPQMVNNP
jgi:Chaperone of endosialidase